MIVSEAGRARLKALMGPRLTVMVRCVLRHRPLPRWGNLRRVEPFSKEFGFDRGTPIDRYYLDRFFDANRQLITGRVLEVQVPSYTRRFGRGVVESHTVDINPRFNATYTVDLAQAPQIPDDYYDCVLAPNTLQHLLDLHNALKTMLRIVRPGGSVLGSAAGFVPLIPEGGDYWRLTPEGWRFVLEAEWAGCDVTIQGHGNCLSAVAAMHGLAHEEMRREELDAHDPRYPVLTTIRCRKPVSGSIFNSCTTDPPREGQELKMDPDTDISR